ncbi:S9 family peptidase [bacterium]|nr:S9 family peptidase [bacterium]
MAALLAAALCLPGLAQALDYPPARTVLQLDNYHGTEVSDPYRWLEDPASPEVKAWVDSENLVTRGFLDAIPGRQRIADRLREVANYERYSSPSQTAGRYFWSRNDGLQNQSVMYWSEGLGGEPRVLLDPNTWSADGTVALAGMDVSEDGKLLLFGKSTAGSDWVEYFVMDIESGRQYPDHIIWSKGGAFWNRDASGFWYERYPEPKEEEKFTVAAASPMYYYHQLGSEQSQDVLVFSIPEHPDWWVSAGLNEGRSRILLTTGEPGSNNNDYSYAEINGAQWDIRPLIPQRDGEYSYVWDEGNLFWFYTTKDAPLGKLIQIDAANPAPENWKTIIPESRIKLNGVATCGGYLWASYLKDVRTQYVKYSLQGENLGTVPLPGRGSAGGFGGRMSDNETFFSYTDAVTPSTIYRYDIPSGQYSIFRQPRLDLELSNYVSEQVFYRSFDGEAVPLTISYRRGLKLDGSNPCILYAYGGFQGVDYPYFSSFRTVWLDMGGVYVSAGIRGGGEYGDQWHKSAIKLNRQVAFNDFIAAAEFLIDRGYTSSSRLAVNGASNGGLLIGAVMTQRPDLFGVALPDVGVMDMLRFNLWGFGKFWESDYGSPQNPDEFKALLAYSPYHNLREGVRYPATLVTTADTDDRVMPGHSYKFAARLQACQARGGPPVLLRVQTDAGHGAGKPFYKVIEEAADTYAFCFENMGLTIPEL